MLVCTLNDPSRACCRVGVKWELRNDQNWSDREQKMCSVAPSCNVVDIQKHYLFSCVEKKVVGGQLLPL